MTQVSRSALVPFSAEQMFTLVNDIESYPQFMPGCTDSRIISRGDQVMVARVDLAKAGIKQFFTTENTLFPPSRIKMTLADGPFRHFDGEWRFDTLEGNGCRVSFSLSFSFSNPILGFAAGKFIEAVASEQVAAVVTRAKQLYAG